MIALRVPAAVLLVVGALAPGWTHAAASTPAQRCAAAQEIGAGRVVRDLVRCGAAGLADGGCRARATGGFDTKWAQAEARGGCSATADAAAIAGAVDASLGDLATHLDLTGAPSRCAAGKFQKAGAAAQCALRCEATGERQAAAADPRCTQACAQRFIAGCGEGERAGDCRTTADCGPLTGRVQRFALDVAATVSGAAGLPCSHDFCKTGAALGEPPCNDPCVAAICAMDDFCCANMWDEICVAEVGSVCGLVACPVCGDGVVDPFKEFCDPAAPSSCPTGQTCSNDCSRCENVCGDGHVATPEEVCDPGAPESCPKGQVCRADCSGC